MDLPEIISTPQKGAGRKGGLRPRNGDVKGRKMRKARDFQFVLEVIVSAIAVFEAIAVANLLL